MTWKFDWRPWKTIPLLYYVKLCIISKPSVISNWSYSPKTPNLGQNRGFFVLCDLHIWWITLKINRALLCYFKLCALFHSHLWIQTGVTVRKHTIWVKIGESFCPLWPWNLTYDLEKQQDTSSMLLQALCIISSQYVNSKLELQSGNS